MEVTFQRHWVSRMAESLIGEITKQMSGIQLLLLQDAQPPDHLVDEMDAAYGRVEGDYQMFMQLRAEKKLFYRFAENMIGDKPEDQSEVEDYATEFFNVLCGRFVSELYIATGRAARFFPTTYERPPDVSALDGQVCSLYFISEKNEYAVFSWTAASVNQLIRRTANG